MKLCVYLILSLLVNGCVTQPAHGQTTLTQKAGLINAVEPVQRCQKKAHLPNHVGQTSSPSSCVILAGKGASQANFQLIANAIRKAEGVWTYGVKTVRVNSEREARQVCLNTISHAWRDWDGRGDFINFLADRYCPPKDDPQGNVHWKHNVHFYTR